MRHGAQLIDFLRFSTLLAFIGFFDFPLFGSVKDANQDMIRLSAALPAPEENVRPINRDGHRLSSLKYVVNSREMIKTL
jgi:hypothetical protein